MATAKADCPPAKLDAEHPRFVQHLLETVYPGFLSPVPSMMIARMRPDPLDPNLGRGFTIPRGSALTSELARGQKYVREMRGVTELQLWGLLNYTNLANNGDKFIITKGDLSGIKGGTNALKIIIVGQGLTP